MKYVRQYDATQPGQVILVVTDVGPLLGASVLAACQRDNEHELDRFTQYATQF